MKNYISEEWIVDGFWRGIIDRTIDRMFKKTITI